MNSRSIADLGIRCVFVFVVLVSIEVLLRILDIPALKTERTELSEAHPYFGWTPRPGLVERMWWRDYWYELSHSEQGLRGIGLVAAQRPAGIKNRILMLGDSVLYGLGASDAEVITEILKQKLPATEIVNTGTPGYGLRQELAVLDLFGKALHPDLVVVIYRWNDPEDDLKNETPDYAFDSDGRVVRIDTQVPDSFDPLALCESLCDALGSPVKEAESAFDSLKLYHAVKNGVHQLRDFTMPPLRRHALRGYLRNLKNSISGADPDRIDTPNAKERAWQISRNILALMQARSDELGADFLVISVPAYALVNESRYGRYDPAINTDIEASLAAVCAELGIEYVDLLPSMQAADQKSAAVLYYERDNHLTPAGNAVVADIIEPILAKYLQ
jgi:lysophospholipase L1-like esterase